MRSTSASSRTGSAAPRRPCTTGDGELVAALSVSAPLFRIGEEALVGDLRCKVVGAAEQLSAALGLHRVAPAAHGERRGASERRAKSLGEEADRRWNRAATQARVRPPYGTPVESGKIRGSSAPDAHPGDPLPAVREVAT